MDAEARLPSPEDGRVSYPQRRQCAECGWWHAGPCSNVAAIACLERIKETIESEMRINGLTLEGAYKLTIEDETKRLRGV